MSDLLLTLNAGSSSLKFALFEVVPGESVRAVVRGNVEGIGGDTHMTVHDASGEPLTEQALNPDGGRIVDHTRALAHALGWLEHRDASSPLIAVGHRVVHGGDRFAAPLVVQDDMLADIAALAPLAPLHQPHNVAAIRALRSLKPELPQVVCFDTAFHQTQPAVARAFALPKHWRDAGVKRYGFHGLSYESVVERLPRLIGELEGKRVVIAHLGNGASLCAIEDGKSIATTMGMTPLDGLMMGTRAGSIDPGVLLHLMDAGGLSSARLARLLLRESGLLGVSGLTNDIRVLLASDSPDARFAIELFVYRIVREMGSLAAALGGLDALVFTGGIGENAAPVRAAVCEALEWLGLALDTDANAAGRQKISGRASRVSAWIIPTDEESVIAAHTARLNGIDAHPF